MVGNMGAGIEPGSSTRAQGLLTTEPSLRPRVVLILEVNSACQEQSTQKISDLHDLLASLGNFAMNFTGK